MKRRLLLALMLGIAGGAFGLGLARMLELNEPRLHVVETLCGSGVAIGLACGVSRLVSVLSASIAFVLPAVFFLVRVSLERRGGLPPMLGALTFPVPIGLAGLLFSGTPTIVPRASSVLSASAKRATVARLLCVLLAAAGVLALAGARPWASLVLAALAIALTALAAFDIRAWDRVASLAASSQPVEEPAPAPANAIDLGVGTQLRRLGPDAIHPYRGVASGPRRARHLLGDPDLATQLLRARAATVSLIVVAAFIAAGLAMTPPLGAYTTEEPALLSQPQHEWSTVFTPVVADADGDGVEDVIGVRRVPVGHRGRSVPCEVAVVSGASFTTLWAMTPPRGCPTWIETKDGTLYVLTDDLSVMILDLATGRERRRVVVSKGLSGRVVSEGFYVDDSHNGSAETGTLVLPSGEVRENVPRPDDEPEGRFACWRGALEPCTPRRRPDEGDFYGDGAIVRRHRDDAFAISANVAGAPPMHPSAANAAILYGFDPRSGKVRWKQDVSAEELSRVDDFELSYGRIYSFVANGNETLELIARDAKTGEIVWQSRLPNGTGTKLLASDKRVYIAAPGRLEVLDRDSRELLGTIR